LRHAESSSGRRNPFGFGGGAEVADLALKASFSNFVIDCRNAKDQDQLLFRV
jgi:hypothetical protein